MTTTEELKAFLANETDRQRDLKSAIRAFTADSGEDSPPLKAALGVVDALNANDVEAAADCFFDMLNHMTEDVVRLRSAAEGFFGGEWGGAATKPEWSKGETERLLYDAVRYALNRVQTDPEFRWHMLHTETFERLVLAESAYTGRPKEEVSEARMQDRQPEYRRRDRARCDLDRDRRHRGAVVKTSGLSQDAERQLRIQLESFASRMARDVIGPKMPSGVGFAFIAFDFGEAGNIAYSSSAKRDDMKRALAELLKRWHAEEPQTLSIEARHNLLVVAASRLATALTLSVATQNDSPEEERLAELIGRSLEELLAVLKMEPAK